MADTAAYNVTEAHIVKTPGTAGGEARIAGRRIKVQHVYIWHEESGMSAREIAEQHDLTLAQVYAALTYAYEHLDEIRAAIHRSERIVAEAMQDDAAIIVDDLPDE